MVILPRSFLTVLFIGLLLCAGCTQPVTDTNAASGTANPTHGVAGANFSVPYPPVPVASREGMNIAYELEMHPAEDTTPVIEGVEVLDQATGAVLYSINSTLLPALYHPAAVPPPTAGELQNGTGKLVYPRVSIWFSVAPGAVPDRLVHRVTLNRTSEGLSLLTVTAGEVAVAQDLRPVVIGSPLRGPGWVALETTSPFTHHFLGQITLGGVTRVPQRFAQDWIRVDPRTGNVANGNASLAKNYIGYGAECYAVADGTVIAALDGLSDIETIYASRHLEIGELAGNSVILEIGNGTYACYGHMVPGSVRVKAGDVVHEGQVLGTVGNSGNSDLPHLHFQVVKGDASFLGAEGYPHVYRSFMLIGGVNETALFETSAQQNMTMADLWGRSSEFVTFEKTPIAQERVLPECYDIVDFP
ncbi:MAG TPA: M23 family metallopeptidase [Methanoregulaceae archaeon]|nr:M23 family metallopeptidase [Methanoregulaceae archaeon]